MKYISYFIFLVYNFALVYTLIYCVAQIILAIVHARHTTDDAPQPSLAKELPKVTIQLPIFNEINVVERLIDCIVQIEYPKERLQIQILDDSTDDTLSISKARAEHYREQGYDIEVVTRSDRSGYKAGALAAAMPFVKGKYIAIFDADFLPKPSFLLDTLPYIMQPNIAVVQTKWGHLNEDYNILTYMQAFQLNVHFSTEQSGRYWSNNLLQFNGTAGVWNKDAITDAGGWQDDTLTEDLDLSMRAQLKGWKIIYREEIESPAELPVNMAGLKSQQFRWMKGGAESARKLLKKIWRSDIRFYQKLQSSVHLLSSSVYLASLALGILSVPFLYIQQDMVEIDFSYMSVFILSTVLLGIIYFYANVVVFWKGSWLKRVARFAVTFPPFLALSMGLSLHNSVAVIQGLLGKKTPFIRTPKLNIIGKTTANKSRKKSYVSNRSKRIILGELLLALYFGVTIIVTIMQGNTAFLWFHVVFFLGFLGIAFFSLKRS